MSPASRPDPVAFAPGSGELPPPLQSALIDDGHHLLLVVAPDAGDATLRTVIGMADARARRGSQTVLADAAFDDVRLHEMLDLPNLEGLADVFEFGASFTRVMTRPETRRFEFIPAGAYVPDPAAVMSSSRWHRIRDELASEGAAILVFTTAGTPGVSELSGLADAAVLVAEERDVDRLVERLDPECEIGAVVPPSSSMAPERLSAEAGDVGVDDATIFDDEELTEPVVFRSDREGRRVSPLLWVLLAIALAVAGWFGYQEYLAPSSGPQGSTVSTAQAAQPGSTPAPQEEPEPEPEPRPVERPLGYSVAVEAHQDPGAARERMARLQRGMPEVRFYLAPVSVNDALYYRVLAGPVASREEGMTLMRELVDADLKSAFDDWAVRPTSLAFHLGEYTAREQAEARVAELERADVPAYIVPIDYEPGADRYRVYGGAFENPAAAAVMEALLEEAGIEAPLIERVGEPVEVDA